MTDGILGLCLQKINAELCNGSTYDSDSYCLGSNPSSAAKTKSPGTVVLRAFFVRYSPAFKIVLGDFLVTFWILYGPCLFLFMFFCIDK